MNRDYLQVIFCNPNLNEPTYVMKYPCSSRAQFRCAPIRDCKLGVGGLVARQWGIG